MCSPGGGGTGQCDTQETGYRTEGRGDGHDKGRGEMFGSELFLRLATTVKTRRATRYARTLLLFLDAGKACCHIDKRTAVRRFLQRACSCRWVSQKPKAELFKRASTKKACCTLHQRSKKNKKTREPSQHASKPPTETTPYTQEHCTPQKSLIFSSLRLQAREKEPSPRPKQNTKQRHDTHKDILLKVSGRTAKKVVQAPAKVGHSSSVSVCATRSSRLSPAVNRKPLPMCAVNSTTRPTYTPRQ